MAGQEKACGSRQERTSPRAPCPKRQPRRSFSTAAGQPRRQECGESRNSIALLARPASALPNMASTSSFVDLDRAIASMRAHVHLVFSSFRCEAAEEGATDRATATTCRSLPAPTRLPGEMLPSFVRSEIETRERTRVRDDAA